VPAAATEPPEFLAPFDPSKGFKHAQRDLTEIFLQLAGSLEAYGSPEPYLKQVASEQTRVAKLYEQKYGKAPSPFRPAYMTDAYIEKLCTNWKFLSPKLGLDGYAREVGNLMRDAIKGTRGNGTIIVGICNQHQSKVFDAMGGKNVSGADFESLRSQLATQLELNKRPPSFEGYEMPRRDAISFALDIQGITEKLFARLDQGMKPADAERIKTYLTSVIIDVGAMAQSELEVGIAEWALTQAKDDPKVVAYNPAAEAKLTPAERKTFLTLLAKKRFTKADFPVLEEFYKGPYDRLSDDGKDELSKRTWNGSRPQQ
jgi:hypothetical protein